MINHIVLMKFKPEAADEAIADLETSLDDLPNHVFEIQMYEFGRDITRSKGSFDFALVALFANPDTLKRYKNNPRYKDVLRKMDRLCESVISVDFEGTDAGSLKDKVPGTILPSIE
jgi:hypothetical protein